MTLSHVNYYDTPHGQEPCCPHCGADVTWVQCEQCDPDYPGFSHHDCGEDCCCCLDPVPNVPCDVCDGKGGWWVCLSKCYDAKKGSLKNDL